MNRGFLQAFIPEHDLGELRSEPIIDKDLKPLYDTAVKHEETNQKNERRTR